MPAEAIIGSVCAIIGVVLALGRVITSRLSHIDGCIDASRTDARENSERVKTELLAQQEKVRLELVARQEQSRQALEAHIIDEARRHDGDAKVRLAMQTTLAWMAGKMGYEPPPSA